MNIQNQIVAALLIRGVLPILVLICAPAVEAINLKVSQAEVVHDALDSRADGFAFTVSWKGSWHNERNHDAAWVFLKFDESRGNQHAYFETGSAEMLAKGSPDMPDAAFEVAEDGTGLFVYPASQYRGRVSYRVFVAADTDWQEREEWIDFGDYQDLLGYGIEMVFIPEGPFSIGDPDERALDEGAFFRSGEDGTFSGPYRVMAEEEEIVVAPEPGSLWYRAEQPQYQGDQSGPVPSSFPKGFEAFYLMKYEISQGLYAEFLNSISPAGQANRANFGSTDYRPLGGTIRLQEGHYEADAPDRRNVFMHWDDMMALLDWAGLRPYTELEYTKAARGPLEPRPLEFAWNTSSRKNLKRRIDAVTHEQTIFGGLTEEELSEDNREEFGASYFWVMDLSGSMWEKVVTIGDESGRSFEGQHGDGAVDYLGYADVQGWPSGVRNGSGYGYRGGGFYGGPDVYRRNPFNRIAFRQYGSWSGGPRNAAYGTRGARSSAR